MQRVYYSAPINPPWGVAAPLPVQAARRRKLQAIRADAEADHHQGRAGQESGKRRGGRDGIIRHHGPEGARGRSVEIINRLRVFGSAHTANLGPGVSPERWLRVGPSEKYAAHRGSMVEEMRMRTTRFARAPQRCTSRLSKHFLLTSQEVTSLIKTRNQLIVSTIRLSAAGASWKTTGMVPCSTRLRRCSSLPRQ